MPRQLSARWSRALFLLAAINITSPLQAGWDGAQWNMTAKQVAAANGVLAPLSSGKRKDRLDGRTVGNVGEQTLGKAKFRVVYYYDEAGLAQITFNHRSGSCESVAETLIEQYGEPSEMKDQIIFRTVTWLDLQGENRVTLMISRGLCDVILQRLST